MAKTIRQGALFSGTGLGGSLSNPIHSHAGRLLGIVITHAQATVQTVIFYDATSLPAAGDEILALHLSPENSPYCVHFPRDNAIPFTTGLCIDAGANCNLAIWSIDYG